MLALGVAGPAGAAGKSASTPRSGNACTYQKDTSGNQVVDANGDAVRACGKGKTAGGADDLGE